METQPEASREYARRLYDRIIAWSEVADRRAQLILALDGVFVSFLVGSILSNPAELKAVTTRFGWETWGFLGLMTFTLVASIFSALRCLVSWLFGEEKVREEVSRLETKPEHMGPETPEVAWYFQVVANMDEEQFIASVADVDAASEAKALARNARRVAGHVVKKHRYVNCGFLCAGVTLLLFLAAGVSHVLRVT